MERRNIMLSLSYDGTNYHGWQKQPQLRTIQGILEECLLKMVTDFDKLRAAGRTDAGVHALGQVVNFHSTTKLPPESIVRGLNSLLPKDIVVNGARIVADDFHARYSAKSKTYLYLILNRVNPSPFYTHYAWHYPYPLDLDCMREAAGSLEGTHDFASFRAASCNARTTIRHLMRLEIERRGDLILFWLEANAFLQHMARNMVGTLVEIGRGKYGPEFIPELLEKRDRTQAGPTAPAQGLFLYKVRYEESGLIEDPQDLPCITQTSRSL